MKKAWKALGITTILIAGIIGGCAKSPETPAVIHVAPADTESEETGSFEQPFTDIAEALELAVPGTTILLHEGKYPPFTVTETASGTETAPVVLRAAEGERAVICGKDGEDSPTVLLENTENFTLQGIEIDGGGYGIFYLAAEDNGDHPLRNVTIADCTVHGIRGTHGICVYAENAEAPLQNLTVSGCEIYDCLCGSSESLALNGNIDGFTVSGNRIHDNDNIGIDMIGFEGTACHDKSYEGNPYDADFVRNGKCCGNVVYRISAQGNEAYYHDGEYDLCADGIYVDGGQNIEIYENFVFCCDIGIEVATEQRAEDNELFSVSGIEVHDNVICGCRGWCGIAFGGYDADRGFTENCVFRNNTLIDNGVQIAVQRSRNNRIENNLCIGASGVEFSDVIREEDMINQFGANLWESDSDADTLFETGSFDRTRIFPAETLQKVIPIDAGQINCIPPASDGFGSSYMPSKEDIALYQSE